MDLDWFSELSSRALCDNPPPPGAPVGQKSAARAKLTFKSFAQSVRSVFGWGKRNTRRKWIGVVIFH